MPDDLMLVGRVARAHGNRGQVIVNPETDFAEDRFVEGRVVQLAIAGRSEPRRIRSVRFQQGRPILTLEGVETIEAADALAGAELSLPVSELAPLPGGTFYRHDLIGCEVKDTSGRVIGRVTDVEGPKEQSRLVVTREKGETLIPMVDGICVSVDPALRLIVIDPPEGLLDL
jgi:16S rRNA processing protein RimM